MDVNDNAGYLNVRVVWTPIASKLAPTVERARQELLIAIIFSAARNGVATRKFVRRLKKRSPPVAIRYGKGLMGGALVIALLALLIQWIGINTIEHYRDDLLFYLQAHLILVLASMLAALVVGIPAGILLSRPSMVGRAERFMQFFNIGNTVPPLAVLAIALGILGIGSGPAIFALFLASLLPIVRNTYEGLKNVQGSLKEAATGIGMTPRQVLWKVELPNAVPIIIGGVRVALAINVGTAPLAFLIGANSLGSLIFPGIALNNQPQLLLGAACTALLALLLDGLVTLASRLWLERGLRPS
jgi:osmoprotectant transport system permease protein